MLWTRGKKSKLNSTVSNYIKPNIEMNTSHVLNNSYLIIDKNPKSKKNNLKNTSHLKTNLNSSSS